MALNDAMRIYMDTDTGGGTRAGTNTSKLVNQTSPYVATKDVSKNTTTANKNTGTYKATNVAQNQQTYGTSYKPATYSGGSSSSGGTTAAAATPADTKNWTVENWNNYLQLQNNLATQGTAAMQDTSNNYQANSLAAIQAAENQYNNTYNTNNALYDQLATQNAQREAAINQSITDYYNNMSAQNAQREAEINKSIQDYYANMSQTNKEKEAATLKAIEEGYANLLGNASEYYNNLMGTYDRSMGYVNQGYEEGKSTTEQARDEALKLAQELYNMGEQTQNRQTEKDLQGQYLSYMNGMKNLNQRLASQGINGGASETAMLGALNGYESSRTGLEEARLSALGALRQQQMQSDSDAQQAYLNKLADLITNRTNQQLNVENARSQGEATYAGMKNDAENNRSNQMVTAQNNFQNWAAALEGNYANMNQQAQTNYQNWANELQSNYANMNQSAQNNYQNWAADLTGQRATNNNTYASNIGNIAGMRENVYANNAQLNNAATQYESSVYQDDSYTAGVDEVSKQNAKAKVKNKKNNKNNKNNKNTNKNTKTTNKNTKTTNKNTKTTNKNTGTKKNTTTNKNNNKKTTTTNNNNKKTTTNNNNNKKTTTTKKKKK